MSETADCEVWRQRAYVRCKWPESTGQVHLAIRQAYSDGWSDMGKLDNGCDVQKLAQRYVDRQWPTSAGDIKDAIRQAYIDGWADRLAQRQPGRPAEDSNG